MKIGEKIAFYNKMLAYVQIKNVTFIFLGLQQIMSEKRLDHLVAQEQDFNDSRDLHNKIEWQLFMSHGTHLYYFYSYTWRVEASVCLRSQWNV